MKTRSRLVRGGALFGLSFLLSSTLAWAGIQPEPFRTGLFGVTAGQAIRISVFNSGGTRAIINPCFRVFDADGALLFEADADPVPSGVGASIEFTPVPEDGLPSGTPSDGRALVRVEVEPIPNDGLPGARLRLLRIMLPTVEVFDTATGRTVFTMPFAEVGGVDPTPFQTGLFGATAGESIRISVLNSGDIGGIITPCFRVFDADGALLFEADAGPLPGGVGTSIEFIPIPEDGLPSGTPTRGRALVRVEVEPIPNDGLPGARLRLLRIMLPTVEVFDTATGRTVFTMPFTPPPAPERP
jgi:hypothetical protein